MKKLIILSVAILLFLASCAEKKDEVVPLNANQSSHEHVFDIKEEEEIPVRITKGKDSYEIRAVLVPSNELNKENELKQFIYKIDFQNKGRSTVQLRAYSFILVDEEGRQYQVGSSAQGFDQTVSSGENLQGFLVFTLAEKTRPQYIQFTLR